MKPKERISSWGFQWNLEGEISWNIYVLGKVLGGRVYCTSYSFSSHILLLLPDALTTLGKTRVAMTTGFQYEFAKFPHTWSIHENTSGSWKDRGLPLVLFRIKVWSSRGCGSIRPAKGRMKMRGMLILLIFSWGHCSGGHCDQDWPLAKL